jgi:hypothetical protein
MLSEGVYTISELQRILAESANESKPKIDPKVIRDDAQNNAKAVKDIMKETGAMEDKATNEKRDTPPENLYDTNKTTLDVNFAYVPSKEYKDRVKSQVHGFASKEHEKNADVDDSIDVSGNKDFYDERENISKEQNEKETEERHAGLKAHNKDKKEFEDNTIYKNESKKMKKLHFKNTVFLSEAQIIKKVPDDYKFDGSRFIMEDKNNNEYLIECKVDDNLKSFTQIKVTKKDTKEQIEEQIKRMQELCGYKSSDYFKDTTCESRKHEDEALPKLINELKDMEKKNNK